MYLSAMPRTNVLTAQMPSEPPAAPAPQEQTQEDAPAPSAPRANYYVKRTQGLSREEDRLVLEPPLELKTSVEYLTQEPSVLLHQDKKEIEKVTQLLHNAKRIPDDSKVIALSNSHPVTLTLSYGDGYGNLYVFLGYSEQCKKPVTLIQDNLNRLYQTKESVSQTLFELAKPTITTLNAKKVNIYTTKHLRKKTLHAQIIEEEDCKPFLTMLNSLKKEGRSDDLSAPDYLVCIIENGKFEEEERWYLWLHEKEVLMAFASDPSTIYRADELTSRSLKRQIKKYAVS